MVAERLPFANSQRLDGPVIRKLEGQNLCVLAMFATQVVTPNLSFVWYPEDAVRPFVTFIMEYTGLSGKYRCLQAYQQF